MKKNAILLVEIHPPDSSGASGKSAVAVLFIALPRTNPVK
jgi:hypothetical protein